MRVGGRGPDNPNTPRAKRNVFTTSELLMSSNYKNRRRYLSLDNAYLKKMLVCKQCNYSRLAYSKSKKNIWD